VDQFREDAQAVAALCRKHGLTAVEEIVSVAGNTVPQLDGRNPLQASIHDYSSTLFGELATQFEAATRIIADARKVAYGELRLRELKWDEHGLPSPALAGWSKQNENIRAAIAVAIDQLSNGLPAYVVLSQLAPASEALVRQLAAKHLDAFHGLNPGGLLKALRNTIGTGPDDHREKVALAVAQSLVSLRNWVIHEADAQWSRDHAVFFLNGLSILLREV
jgi:hypothetical protein